MKAVKGIVIGVFAAIGLGSAPGSTGAADESGKQAVVLFEEAVDAPMLFDESTSVEHVFSEIPAASVVVTPEQKQQLEQTPGVASVTYDTPVQSSAQTVTYGYEKVGMRSLTPSTLTGAGVKIGILDSGIDASHPDLVRRVVGGECLMTIIKTNGCPDGYMDDSGHGTHVAGIIAANNNTFGTVGVAPASSLYAIKVLDGNGMGSTSTLIAGIEWAIRQKLDMINISITAPVYEPALEKVLQKAYDSGMLIVAAAGNTGPPSSSLGSSVEYPAKFASVIAVSSIDANDNMDPLSSTGPEVEFSAPGVKIYSLYPGADFTTASGTSMAAPFVTGVAALYKQKYPDMTNKQIRALLQKNAKDLGTAGRDAKYGYGLVHVDQNTIDQLSVPAASDGSGKVTIDTSELAGRYESFNIYRGDVLVTKNSTGTEWTDYASAGTVSYTFRPVVNGKESAVLFRTMKVKVSAPVIRDLNAQKWYDRYMMYVNHAGYMDGFPDGTFRPETAITRGEAAILIGKALGLNGTQRDTSFSDVSEKTVSSGYVQSLMEAGITSGFPDGTFRPAKTVTRAEMAIMMSRAFNIATAASSTLTDVSEAVTGYEHINGVVAAGIAFGYEDNTFRPYTNMNRAQFAAFLSRALNEELR